MRKSRHLLWLIPVGIGFLAMLVILLASIPSASKQVPPNSAPILAAITYPANDSLWSADTPIPISVMVTGKAALQKVELWVDGSLFDSKTSGKDYFYAVWNWMPQTEGDHAFFARATNVKGQTADSNAVHVHANHAVGFSGVMTTKGGETLQSLAEKNGIPVQQLVAENPSLDPQAPLSAGQQVFLPIQFLAPISNTGATPAPPPIVGPISQADQGSPAGLSVLGESALHLSTVLPVPPGLSASVGVCNVTLTIQDNSPDEDGFFVYALENSAASFQRLASLKSHDGTGALQYMVPNLHGQVQFYVSAYNALGEAPSTPVQLEITSPECNLPQTNSGDLQYKGGFLILPPGTQLAYMYYSVNGGTWQRLPGDHEFLEPTAGKVDLRAKLQQLLGGAATGEVDLDVWGWSGSTLVHLGQLHLNINFASLAICNLSAGCAGDVGSTHWVTQATVGSDQTNRSRAFRWIAQGTDITYGIWQVSRQPFPLEYSIGAPPGLLASGISDATVDENSGSAAGDFTVDFGADLQSTAAKTFKHSSFQVLGQGNDPYMDSLLPGLAMQWNGGLGPNTFQVWLPQTLYIRVTPMAGGHPASDPSNTVTVTYQPTGPTPTTQINKVPTYKVEIVPDSYTNDVKAIPKLGVLGCSVITGADHDAYIAWYKQNMEWEIGQNGNAAGGWWIGVQGSENQTDQNQTDPLAEASFQVWASHVGWTVCPAASVEHQESTLEWVVSGIGEALTGWWNSLKSALDTIKGDLIDAIASIIPGCDSGCRSVLMTGLNFTITYFTGLPPDLPSYDDMVDMGINYAVQTAITESGVPYCDETCQQQITNEIKDIGSQVAHSSAAQPACLPAGHTMWVIEGGQQYTLQPLCIPPGISSKPVKGSMYENATLQVRVTRIDGSAQPVPAEMLVIDPKALNFGYGDGHSAWETTSTHYTNWPYAGYNYTMIYNAPLVGTPFQQAMVGIPPLKAGQSIVVPVVFSLPMSIDFNPPNAYPPRMAAVAQAFPGIDLSTAPIIWSWDFQHLTDSGAQIILNAQVLCQDQPYHFFWNSPCSNTDTRQFIAP